MTLGSYLDPANSTSKIPNRPTQFCYLVENVYPARPYLVNIAPLLQQPFSSAPSERTPRVETGIDDRKQWEEIQTEL